MTGSPGAGRPAIVIVHGGPGSTHDYLRSLGSLAVGGWPVVHYDQLGNGGSTHLPEQPADFWTPGLFLDELDNLLARLRVDGDYILLGQSWGGMLAAWHASRRPPGLRGLIVANAPASYPTWRSEMAVLRAALPPGVDAVLRAHEAAGTTGSAEYTAAMRVFYDRHVCRLDPWPRDYRASFMEIVNDPTVYAAMNGPSEFHVIGSLRDWTIEEHLPAIAVPTLVLSGRYDEATEAVVRPYGELVPGARRVVFEESSHLPHLEEPERFLRVLAEFLLGLEKG
ncbi:proline iminopeptidase-family hydrolase [Actinomadura latina]|uniref:Proline iminopeptidase n=2 Tax=Actinomadura latina TaxID=163603 RepID=A0A846ZCV7_9ACTN|nr:proline iminopeptidase-family hydrolase [Actinomadura latina]